MQHDSTIKIFQASGARSGGACVRFDHDAGVVLSAWCGRTEVRVPITRDQASALAEFMSDLHHEGAAHVFTQHADLFNGDHP